MRVSITDAKAQLNKLIRRAEAGEEIVLTIRGQDAVRLVPTTQSDASAEKRREFLKALSRRSAAKATPGRSAAHSQDFLYDEDGLPG